MPEGQALHWNFYGMAVCLQERHEVAAIRDTRQENEPVWLGKSLKNLACCASAPITKAGCGGSDQGFLVRGDHLIRGQEVVLGRQDVPGVAVRFGPGAGLAEPGGYIEITGRRGAVCLGLCVFR